MKEPRSSKIRRALASGRLARAAATVAATVAVTAAAAGGCNQTPIESGSGGSSETVAEAKGQLTSAQVCLSIARQGASGTVWDAQIKSNSPTTPAGGSQTVNAGVTNGVERQTLLKFDLSAIPSGPNTNITTGMLNIAEYQALTTLPGTIEVHRILSPWNEATVTWNSFAGAYDSTISASMNAAAAFPSTNIQSLVQAWVRGTLPNEGVLLKQPGSTNTAFFSSEFLNYYSRPNLYVCYTVTCNAGFADCNTDGRDGCETDLSATAAHCGACGQACNVPNAAAACVNTTCQVGSCNLGFADCDGSAGNGCETLLTTNTDCGGCGVTCARANGTASCSTGTCALTACDAGYYDCDGNPANGCEPAPCADGGHCGTGADCASGVCLGGFCAAALCTDGVKNGGETGVDCGGGSCPPCAAGGGCAAAADCASGVCASGSCQPASCTDAVKNGSETGIDCGGGACPGCGYGQVCALGTDCLSGVCTAGTCQGSACNDGLKNGAETAVDCGGGTCAPCAAGKTCATGADCVDLVCGGGVCQIASCSDGVLNGSETDVDCGGASCPACPPADKCTADADCGSGVCQNGICQVPSCSDGVKNGDETGVDCGGACYKPETCNGVDDDCNGLVDDGLGSTTCGVGACQVTVQNCVAGQAQACVPGTPGVEICDGLIDDDCDGVVDNGCACIDGRTQACYTGAPATLGLGVCQAGVQTCAHGAWGACVGEVTPSAETCDGIDNDCNGQVDDGLGQTVCGLGECQVTTPNCVNGYPQTCVPRAPSAEVCDGLDNDCNGIVDDDGQTVTCGVGACQVTVATCANGQATTCTPAAPSAESCNGIDDDCDGVIDDGNPGGGLTCSTGKLGACAAGTTQCSSGQIVCQQNAQPKGETCNGIDDNCDGTIDEGNPGGGVACSTGKSGVCAAGTTACTGGQLACNQNTQASAEVCDGLDNNCNGTADEGNPGGGAACGTCNQGTTTCSGGAIVCSNANAGLTTYYRDADGDGYGNPAVTTQACSQPAGYVANNSDCNDANAAIKPGATEVCDGVDNNCNGSTDEGNPGGGATCGTCNQGTTVCSGGAITCSNASAGYATWYRDADADGYGTSTTTTQACSQPAGYVANSSDCNDANAAVKPGAAEVCDSLDNDCNGTIDDGCNPPTGMTTLVLMPMDGSGTVSNDNASADFTNFANAGAVFSPTLAPSISVLTPKYGTGSGSFKNGSIKTASSAANVIGSADFTIEFWAKYSGALDTFGSTVVSGTGWDISLGNSGYNNNADFAYGNQGARWWGGPIGWGVLPTATWVHLSISRSGTSMYTHLNGVLKQTLTVPANARLEGTATASALTVGSFPGAYIDDLQITVGGVKHTTANFTPAQLTNVPTIYLPMDGPGGADFRNAVTSGPAMQLVGAPKISGGSATFASGSNLTTATTATTVIGTRDFTIEFWVNHAGLGGGGTPVVSAASGTTGLWDISLGNSSYNNNADFAYYTTENSGYRHWGGDISWGVLPTNTWTHLSLTRSGTTLMTHKNGVLVNTKTILATDRMEGPSATTSALTIGGSPCQMDDLMITLGAARHTTANFTVVRAANYPRLVPSPEPYIFLPLDGANASTAFPNLAASTAAFTASGTPSITTATSKYGAASGNFQTGSIVTQSHADNVLGTRDFTIELWVNYSAQGGFGTPIVAGNGWDISLGNTNYNGNADFAYANQSSRHWGGSIGWGALPKNTWTHIALSRSYDRLYTHKNGTLVSVIAISPTADMEAGALTSAITVGGSPSYLDDVVITRGAAKYSTADFAVPAANTKMFMYLPMDGANGATTFPNYGTGPVVTNTSTPSITTSTAVHGGASANLTTGSIATASSAAYKLGTSDFTIEFWVKHSSLGTFGSTVLSGTGWDISLGNANYNNSADFAFYTTQASGTRHWGGDVGWGVLPTNTWTHLSLTRSGTRLYTHKNGVLMGVRTLLATDSMEGPNAASAITVGGHPSYIDDVQITIGTARHTSANFTVYP